MGQSASVGRQAMVGCGEDDLRSPLPPSEHDGTQNNFAYVLSAPLQPAWPGRHWLDESPCKFE